MSSIDFTKPPTLFLNNEDDYSVAWSGIFCYTQSFTSDYIGLHVVVSNSDDTVTVQSSAFAALRFNFTSDNLEKRGLAVQARQAGLVSKRICGTLNVLYEHSGVSSGCEVQVGDSHSNFGTTSYYPNQVQIKGSPFTVKVVPGIYRAFFAL